MISEVTPEAGRGGNTRISQASHLLQQFWTYATGRENLLPAMAVVLFCILAIGVILTKRPWVDEGWLADITYNLIHHRVMGLTVLDPHGFPFAAEIRGIDRHTYWILPNYLFLQAAWCWILGLNLFTFRLLSVAWGAIALFSWYFIVCRLTQNRTIGFISVLILALDQNFVLAGATGRMDMMCAALNLAASAVYLSLRRRFHLAIFAAACVLAAALMTHPNALFGVILLILITWFLDRQRVRWRTLLIAAVPFLVALGVWSVYVFQAPDIFISQVHAQTKMPHRFEFDWNLVRHFRHEFAMRYGIAYHLRSRNLLAAATGSVFVLYFGGLLGWATVKAMRSRPGSKQILLLAVISCTLLSCLQDNWYYLVYVLPALATAAAVCMVWLWERQSALGRLAALAAASTVLLNASVPAFRIFHNNYRGRYVAAVNYLKENMGPSDLVMGSAELDFGLGFDGRVIDDCRLGFSSGQHPAYIVLEDQYYIWWFPMLSVREPKVFRHIRRVLDEEYDIVYDQEHDRFITFQQSDLPYRIYRRKERPLVPK